MSVIKKLGARQNGFSLIEVMVAVFVLAIGLLGLAGLQVASLKSNHSAQLRTEAVIHIYDIIDRMRINKQVAKAGGYDITLLGASPNSGSVVDNDLFAWKNALSASLPLGPTGGGAITTVAGVTTITIQWDDSRGVNGNSTQRFSMSTEL
ncbi:type IV pilus modification protein PilV [Cycloclasticus pugetii]|jgi:type IV pilus assembly protein PilV|uniref:type IV pilus modification protein PilV n=1 Tax=Cycloclasticus pugetii TaxID=34068 RepID=UPI0024098192|nr:type IV pilus modification protein PilV [Cycloclasticus pugetii]MDF1830390.1 type IV pilus modification protein PilV [Cycloclasticus pugetii]